MGIDAEKTDLNTSLSQLIVAELEEFGTNNVIGAADPIGHSNICDQLMPMKKTKKMMMTMRRINY